MIAYVFIGIKLADIMMIWRIMRTMASMMIIRCSAGRMEWKNGFVLVLIEAIIDDIFSQQTRYFNAWSRACRICIIAMGMLL